MMFSGVALWMQTGERQTARLRLKYLQSVLKKDINFFDIEARDTNIIYHISSDAILVQDAIGDKVYISANKWCLMLYIYFEKYFTRGPKMNTIILCLLADRPCFALPFSVHCWICHWIYIGMAAFTSHLGCCSIDSFRRGSLYYYHVYLIRKR
jgi:hypothetical protein